MVKRVVLRVAMIAMMLSTGRARARCRASDRLWTLISSAAARAAVLVIVCLLAAPIAGARANGPEIAPDRLIVRQARHATRSAVVRSYERAGVATVRELPHAGVSIVRIHRKGRDVRAVAKELLASGVVERAELDVRMHASATVPNDPLFPETWGLSQANGADIDAPEAWDYATGASRVVVGVIDTGVDYDHPDLAANVWNNPGELANGLDDDGNGWVDDLHGVDCANDDGDPMDDDAHGTHVSGTIAASGNDGIGVAGVAWHAQIMALKFLSAGGSGWTSDAIECLDYATEMKTHYGVDLKLTNNSWGCDGPGCYSQALEDSIRAAGDAGMLFVAAAGNSSNDNDGYPSYPSGYALPNVIAVAATDRSDQLASFSSYGANSVHLAAPGVDVLSTVPGGGYESFSGTSMATPHVSGAAVLLFAANPEANADGVKAALLASVDPLAALTGFVATGGRLDVGTALASCAGEGPFLAAQPAYGFRVELGSPLTLSASLSECDAPVSGAVVTVGFDDGTPAITLRDDGAAPDPIANDGRHTGSWTPVRTGTASLAFHAQLAAGSRARTVEGEVFELPAYAFLPETQFDWIDVSQGVPIGPLGDDDFRAIDLGFSFPFYDGEHETVTVASNGYLTFGSEGAVFVNQPLPSTGAPRAMIAPYWDDLNPSDGGSIVALRGGIAPRRWITVAWLEVPYYGSPTGSASFEATLRENGLIEFRYLDVENGSPDHDRAVSATVGLQDATGTSGVLHSQDQAAVASGTKLVAMKAVACNNGRDDDGDGAVDVPADPDCLLAWDAVESPSSRCGLLGIELLLVPAIGYVRRRLRKS